MQSYLKLLCFLMSSLVVGCVSNDTSAPKISPDEKLLVLTSYVEYPNNRLILYHNGTYAWKHFDAEKLSWQNMLSGKLDASSLAEVERLLCKAPAEPRLTGQTKVKNEHGKEVDLKTFKVIRQNGHFIYNFSELNSFIFPPKAIKLALDKCNYIEVLKMLGSPID